MHNIVYMKRKGKSNFKFKLETKQILESVFGPETANDKDILAFYEDVNGMLLEHISKYINAQEKYINVCEAYLEDNYMKRDVRKAKKHVEQRRRSLKSII